MATLEEEGSETAAVETNETENSAEAKGEEVEAEGQPKDAASPPCCPPGSVGQVDPPKDYVEKGKEIELGSNGEAKAYVSEPKEFNGKAILCLHDVFGPDSGRTKQICDIYAEKGYLVVMPYMYGNYKPLSEANAEPKGFGAIFSVLSTVRWLQGVKYPVVRPALEQFAIPYLRERKATNVGIVCFCYGCYPMVHLLSQHEKFPELNCGVGMHPSMQVFVGLMQRGSPLVAKIKAPLLMNAAGNDPSDVKKNGWVDKAFKKKDCYEKTSFVEYKDMIHGWVNRGDLTKEKVKRDYDLAMEGSFAFFEKNI